MVWYVLGYFSIEQTTLILLKYFLFKLIIYFYINFDMEVKQTLQRYY